MWKVRENYFNCIAAQDHPVICSISLCYSEMNTYEYLKRNAALIGAVVDRNK